MPLNVKGLPVFHREPDTSVFRMPDPEEVRRRGNIENVLHPRSGAVPTEEGQILGARRGQCLLSSACPLTFLLVQLLALAFPSSSRECADLHEYSQLLEEELEENKRKVLAQAAQIERLEEELVKERQKRQRETDQLRLRLASVTEEG
eukprot:1646682-Rhodomonas_salina.2